MQQQSHVEWGVYEQRNVQKCLTCIDDSAFAKISLVEISSNFILISRFANGFKFSTFERGKSGQLSFVQFKHNVTKSTNTTQFQAFYSKCWTFNCHFDFTYFIYVMFGIRINLRIAPAPIFSHHTPPAFYKIISYFSRRRLCSLH